MKLDSIIEEYNANREFGSTCQEGPGKRRQITSLWNAIQWVNHPEEDIQERCMIYDKKMPSWSRDQKSSKVMNGCWK